MMKTHIVPQHFLFRRGLDYFIEFFIVRIISISDYLCNLKQITLSEWTMFLINAAWTFSFVFYEVKNSAATYEYMFSETLWTLIFLALFAAHLTAFIRPSIKIRYVVITFYAMIWFIWTVITYYSNPRSPVWEICFVLMLVSIVLAVRLHNESRITNDC